MIWSLVAMLQRSVWKLVESQLSEIQQEISSPLTKVVFCLNVSWNHCSNIAGWHGC